MSSMSRQDAEFYKEIVRMMFPDDSIEIKGSFGPYILFKPEASYSIQIHKKGVIGRYDCEYACELANVSDSVGFIKGWIACQFERDLTNEEISNIKFVEGRVSGYLGGNLGGIGNEK